MSGAEFDFETVDFFRGNELIADPYPYFDWVRARRPVYREPNYGVYMVTGYDDSAFSGLGGAGFLTGSKWGVVLGES